MPHEYMTIPILFNHEVKCGKLLGQGSFCHVMAVTNVVLQELPTNTEEEEPQHQARRRLAHKFATAPQRPRRNLLDAYGRHQEEQPQPVEYQPPRLALKRIRQDNNKRSSASNLETARQDLKREMEILVALSASAHPNIIELHAIGIDKEEDVIIPDLAQLQPSFLVLSQIQTTLTRRLHKWREQRGLGIYEALSIDVQGSRNLWIERLLVAVRISKAIQYLHSHRILNRDVKPDNVGFDYQNVPKLFDFGLAKRIKIANEDDGLYKLTGETGSTRYMSPEVALNQPYGWTADVYSLAILTYEVLSLKIPFAGIAPSTFYRVVFVDGERPPLDPSWPTRLQRLLESMWDADPKARPTSEQVVTTLEEMLRGSDEELFPAQMIQSTTSFFNFEMSKRAAHNFGIAREVE
jgi:serine/threonine protein kinase